MNRKRKKGGGRKFADGKISEARFIRYARKWFLYQFSIKMFLERYGISRQSYYRFLNKREWFKKEVFESRKTCILCKRNNRQSLLKWLKDNPDKNILDSYFRCLENIEVKL